MDLAIGVLVIKFLKDLFAAAHLAEHLHLVGRVITGDQITDDAESRVATREIRHCVQIAVQDTVGNRVDGLAVRNHGLGGQNFQLQRTAGHDADLLLPTIGHEPVRPVTCAGAGLNLHRLGLDIGNSDSRHRCDRKCGCENLTHVFLPIDHRGSVTLFCFGRLNPTLSGS